MVVGMIDYGTCSIEHIEPCSESFLDGIRVILETFEKGCHGVLQSLSYWATGYLHSLYPLQAIRMKNVRSDKYCK